MAGEKIQVDKKVDTYVTYLRCLNYIEKRAREEGHKLYEGKEYPIQFIKKEMIQYLRDNFVPDDTQEYYMELYKYLENQLIKYGPITELLKNPNVKKIYIEGAKHISYRSLNNKIIDTDLKFKNSVQVTKLINRFTVGKDIEMNADTPIGDIEIDGIGRVIIMHKSLNKDDDDRITIIKL